MCSDNFKMCNDNVNVQARWTDTIYINCVYTLYEVPTLTPYCRHYLFIQHVTYISINILNRPTLHKGEFGNVLTKYYKNLAIANRSRVSCINTNNNTMTLKSGFEVTQGH